MSANPIKEDIRNLQVVMKALEKRKNIEALNQKLACLKLMIKEKKTILKTLPNIKNGTQVVR